MTNHDTGKVDAKKARIIVGDCLEVLKGFESDSIDSLVTDPPAGIGFMGQEWDHHKGGRAEWVAWMTGVMRECHRVMKPGAHGLVWAIPRTSHWTATALEDAGFEVRDIVSHIFGSGFPKSLDISKAIDKAAGAEREVVGTRELTGKARVLKGGNFDGGYDGKDLTAEYAITTPATDAAKQWSGWGTALKPAAEFWILVRKRPEELTCEDLALSAVPSTRLTMHGLREAEDLLARTVADLNAPQGQKERLLLVGRAVNGLEATDMSRLAQSVDSIDLSTVSSWKDISDADLEKVKTFTTSTATKPIIDSKTSNCSQSASTQDGTTSDRNHLTPNAEFYILIRKPISEKNVALNVKRWGTGGLNIDGCRIAAEARRVKDASNADTKRTIGEFKEWDGTYRVETKGRFPANLVLSHSPHCTDEQCDIECAIAMLDEQSLAGGMHSAGRARSAKRECEPTGMWKHAGDGHRLGDSGGASRFFYCAKISPGERNAGLEGMPERRGGGMSGTLDGTLDGTLKTGSGNERNSLMKNHHPTVKPQKLMRYLCKLVTPPGGLVLDPFAGSFSTGVAALAEGFGFIGIEKEADYIEIGKRRLAHAHASYGNAGTNKSNCSDDLHNAHSDSLEKAGHDEQK